MPHMSFRLRLSLQLFLLSEATSILKGALDILTVTPDATVIELPSRLSRKEPLRDPAVTEITDRSLATSGRMVNAWGAIGDMAHTGAEGCIIGPPADRLYAIEPVGVDIIRPSPR